MPSLIEREETSPVMREALRCHILREREKRKQEVAEAEKDFERKAKEEEEKRKKEEEQHSTIADIKEQLTSLQEKLESLRQEKHNLFWQFKKVLSEESKRKQRLREQSEFHSQVNSHYPPGMNPGSTMQQARERLQKEKEERPKKDFPSQGYHQQGVKRPHSPGQGGSAAQHSRSSSYSNHSSPQHKFDTYSGHNYQSPGRLGSHSQSHGNLSSSSIHPNTSKSQDHSTVSEEHIRNRPRMMPHMNPQQYNPLYQGNRYNTHTSSSPKLQVKTEINDQGLFSSGSSGGLVGQSARSRQFR